MLSFLVRVLQVCLLLLPRSLESRRSCFALLLLRVVEHLGHFKRGIVYTIQRSGIIRKVRG